MHENSVQKRDDDVWVRQSHEISRGAYKLPPLARRVVFVAMANVQERSDGDLTATFSKTTLLRMLGRQSAGGKDSKEIEAALDELQSQNIEITKPDGLRMKLTWFPALEEITPGWGEIELRFNRLLKSSILDFRDKFSVLSLKEFGLLTGRHSQRIYEIVMSFSGFKGKNGNADGEWWCEFPTAKLRELLDIAPHEYKAVDNFRRRVIDAPVQEINKKVRHLRIQVSYVREARRLVGVRFNASAKRTSERVVNPPPPTQTDSDAEAYKELNPVRYQIKLDEELAKPIVQDLGGVITRSSQLWIGQCEETALERLKHTPGVVHPKKRGRPPKPDPTEEIPDELLKRYEEST